MRKHKIFFTLIVFIIALSLALVSCDDGGGGGSSSSGNPYRVTYHAGEGEGVPPYLQTVGAGHIIELPGQETMTHSGGKVLSGWRSSLNGTVYNPYDRYLVNADVDFTAQWDVPPKLSTPTEVSAAVLSSTSVRVTWNTAYSATSYDVYYEVESSTNKNFAGSVSSPPYTHDGLQPNTTYYYYVKAKNSEGESAFSQSASVKTTSSDTGDGGTDSGGDNSGTGGTGNDPGTGSTGGTGNDPGTGTGDYPIVITYVQGVANKLNWLKSHAQSGGNYLIEVTEDETIGSYDFYYDAKSNITVTLKGIGSNRTISSSETYVMLSVQPGVTLVLDNNITLFGNGNKDILLWGGSLIMNSGSAISGGDVLIMTGAFNMAGGTISGASSSGVSIVNGVFNMTGGTISGNNTYYGGGVNLGGGGIFNMSGGTISGNTTDYGGGVYNGGIFSMTGGTISGNTASYGGGVYNSGKVKFTKTGNSTIYGYSSSDSNSNVAKDSGMVVSGRGHAVYASSKYKDTTAGPGVDLSYDGSSFSGGWDN